MNRQLESFTNSARICPLLRGGLASLLLLAWLAATAHGQSQVKTSDAISPIYVKHVLGFGGVQHNVGGELSIQDDDLCFQQNGIPVAQISVTSIHNISLGDEDRQIGGVPMMLGKTAVPFGGGRIVSLFSHKKYDNLTIEYIDSSGGFHGAIFLLTKGEGQTFRNALVARGAHETPPENPPSIRQPPEQPANATLQWSVQVARIDPGATTLDSSFSDALYENILEELPGSKQFKYVFRSGDSNANDPGVLVLKMLVEKYSPGSETRRAVTTIAGATKLKVRLQLLTRDNRVVLERTVEGDVRFIGDNLRATNNVAHNTAKLLKRSTLPQPATTISQQSGKEPTSIP